jgi:hypothetical protein
VGPSYHQRVSVPFGEIQEGGLDPKKALVENGLRVSQSHHGRGVHDVLGRGTQVNELPCVRADDRLKEPKKRDQGVAGLAIEVFVAGEVQKVDLSLAADAPSRILGDHP